jgi:HAD superfamily hydrolase (TIGR01509 family)
MPKVVTEVPRLPTIAAVVFDLDGVLVDSEPLHFRAANRVLARHGASISEADYISSIGLGELATWRAWRMRFRLRTPIDALLAEHTAARLREIEIGPAPIGEAVALARRLHAARMPLAIASSSTPRIIDALLRAIGLDDVFGVRVSGEDPEVQHSKPAPDVYLVAAARLQIDAYACLAIEDSGPGVAAATGAGMTCIAVPNRWTLHQDFSGAHIVVESLRYFPLIVF